MKAMTVVAIAIGTRNHGINGKTLGVYLRSARMVPFPQHPPEKVHAIAHSGPYLLRL